MSTDPEQGGCRPALGSTARRTRPYAAGLVRAPLPTMLPARDVIPGPERRAGVPAQAAVGRAPGTAVR